LGLRNPFFDTKIGTLREAGRRKKKLGGYTVEKADFTSILSDYA
jgi:hypothetical protein